MFKLVYIGPKEFKVLIYRLTAIGIIVLIVFNFGSWLYLYSVSKITPQTTLKNFASILNNSTQQNLELIVGDEKITVTSNELKNWIEPYTRSYTNEKDMRMSQKFHDYLANLAVITNIEPVDAKFEFGKDNKVTLFNNPTKGVRFNISKSAESIIRALREGNSSVVLPIETIEPEITLEKVNNLGIKTLLSKGVSDFTGSSKARINNIKAGSNKFNGTIIKPGEEFSFNNILGDVDEKTGYEYELVIKSGKPIPEYGGGICQVSTTIFRAAILAGLPITERRPHSFPVKYYSPQGFDATIYPGVTNLKFINDTPGHILIQIKTEGTKLTVEFYGSSDDRQTIVNGPYQYDQKTNGALKAYFLRTISYTDKEKKQERFDSNYQAPFAQIKNPLE